MKSVTCMMLKIDQSKEAMWKRVIIPYGIEGPATIVQQES